MELREDVVRAVPGQGHDQRGPEQRHGGVERPDAAVADLGSEIKTGRGVSMLTLS